MTSSLSSLYPAKMTGIGSAFPAKDVTNDDLAAELAKQNIETSDEWIQERTGIQRRRVSEPGNEAERNSSLGLRAAQKALAMAGKKAQDIDHIIYATCTPDTLVPSTACWLQSKLEAPQATAFDINAACSGFVYGVSLSNALIQSGQAKTILLVGAEVLSSFLNWSDRTSCILFGDGAGAAIIERGSPEDSSRILSTHTGADGNLWDLFYINAGGSNRPVDQEVIETHAHKMSMKGREIFKVAVRTLSDYAVKALEENGYSKDDLDWLIPHQANLRIIDAVAKRLDFPMEKVLVNVDRYGNTSAATVPTALEEGVSSGKIKRGDLVLMDVFGAGLTYGSALIRW